MDKVLFILTGFAVLLVVSAAMYTMGEKELAHTMATLSWVLLFVGIIISIFEKRKKKHR